jgi:hypothetical protein
MRSIIPAAINTQVALIRGRHVPENGLLPVIEEHNGRMRFGALFDVIRYDAGANSFVLQSFRIGLGRGKKVWYDTLPVNAATQQPSAECISSKTRTTSVIHVNAGGPLMLNPMEEKILNGALNFNKDVFQPGFQAEEFGGFDYWVRFGETRVHGRRINRASGQREDVDYFWSPKAVKDIDTLIAESGYLSLEEMLHERFGDSEGWDHYLPHYMCEQISNASLFVDAEQYRQWNVVDAGTLNRMTSKEENDAGVWGGLCLDAADKEFREAFMERDRSRRQIEENKKAAYEKVQQTVLESPAEAVVVETQLTQEVTA